jgi:hypothetical protein
MDERRKTMLSAHGQGDSHRLPLVGLVAERLIVLYGDEASVRRLLGQAGIDDRRVLYTGRMADTAWFAAVEAARQGMTAALVRLMCEEYPQDEMVSALVTMTR